MSTHFSTYSYTPLFNLKKSDFINLRSNISEYVPLGLDNLLPTQLNKLAREVPVHRAILNAKTNYVIGKGLASNDPDLQRLIRFPNNIGLSLTELMRRIVFDYYVHGNAWIELVTDKKGSFLNLFHADASKIRIAAEEAAVIVHPDWENYNSSDKLSQKISLFPYFTKGSDGLYHAIYHIKDYEPEFYYYGLCSYFAGLRSIIITGLANVWNQRRLERHFSSPGLLVIPGVNDPADAQLLDNEFTKFQGADGEKAMELIIQYLSDPAPGTAAQMAQYLEFKRNEEGNWMDLHKQAEMSLITIHNWFRTLTPYSDDKSGFDRNRIISEYEIAMATIIRPHQEMFLQHLFIILSHFNIQSRDLDFINEPPVQKINPYKFVWEVRRDQGLDFDPNDPIQQQLIIQIRNTFGSNNTAAGADAGAAGADL
jgi:hypothetical protein